MRNAKGLALVPSLITSPIDDEGFREVTDADEEIFLLYTLSAALPDRRGLGQVDNKSDLLQISIDLCDEAQVTEISAIDIDHHANNVQDERRKQGKTSGRHVKVAKSQSNTVQKSSSRYSSNLLQVQIRQSSTSLRSTAGDTGSVVWRSSIYLAEKITRDLTKAEQGSKRRHHSEPIQCLLDPETLIGCRVLELGSGTGILPLLLLSHAYLDGKVTWLATDQQSMLPLLRQNLKHLTTAHVGAIDWEECSQVYLSRGADFQQSFVKEIMSPFRDRSNGDEGAQADLIIATDCVFNPSLFGPLVNTLNLLSSAPFSAAHHNTIVMVVCELREPEAMTQFLETWLQTGRQGERWKVYSLEGKQIVGVGLDRGSVIWVGCRV